MEKEIRSLDDQSLREEELLRLQEAAKNYQGDDKIISSYDLAKIIKERPEEKKIMSSFSGLDNILIGFRLKQLVVISAPTKSGKTSFCIELTSRMKEEKPMWLPFEEGAEELITKFLERNIEPPHDLDK